MQTNRTVKYQVGDTSPEASLTNDAQRTHPQMSVAMGKKRNVLPNPAFPQETAAQTEVRIENKDQARRAAM